MGTKYKRKETKVGLSLLTLLISLNIGILVYCGAAYTNKTSRVCDIFMNFFVFPRKNRELIT